MMDAPNPGYLARTIRQVNEVVMQMRRSGLLLLPDLPERAGHLIRGNEGDSRRYFNDSPMALMPLGIQLEIYESIRNYIWNNEFAGHNVGRVLVEGSSGINEGDSRSNNEGVDLDEDNLVIDNNDGSEGREVYLWSDCFQSSTINQNHNYVWLVTALVCPPNVWPLSITEYNDGTDSEDSLPDLEDGDSLPDLELNY
jgi:hypothetical protein